MLKNKKVVVIISDYGALSRNLLRLKQIFEKNKISHHILEINEWLDCSAISPYNRNLPQKKEIFKLCCAKNMPTLFDDGKLYRCPYAANAARLLAVPDNKSDYVNMLEEPLNEAGVRQTKNKLRDYLLNKEYLEICDFCSGRPLSGREVEPNVQINKPLKYHKYIAK